MNKEQLAQRFHETHEKIAPQFNYETRKASAKPWSDVTENNKKLMIAVAGSVLCWLENEKYNLPCPYNPKAMCVQMPGDREVDDFYCDNGCPNRPPADQPCKTCGGSGKSLIGGRAYTGAETCPHCKGTGIEPESADKPKCETCGGYKKVSMCCNARFIMASEGCCCSKCHKHILDAINYVDCPDCQSADKGKPCTECNGSGVMPDIKIDTPGNRNH